MTTNINQHMDHRFKGVEEYLTLSAEDDAGVSQDVLCEETAETEMLGLKDSFSICPRCCVFLPEPHFYTKVPPDKSNSKPRKTIQLFCKKRKDCVDCCQILIE